MSIPALDIAANRRRREYERAEMIRRVLWSFCWPLFALSPRPLFAWRNAILKFFGARIGKHVHIYNSATIYMPWNLVVGDWSAIGEWALIYNLDKVHLGNRVTVSHRAHLCAGTHDDEQSDLPLVRKEIHVDDQAWVCADAFVGPGLTIGEGAVVGARAVVVKDIAPWAVVVGNPARTTRTRKVRTA